VSEVMQALVQLSDNQLRELATALCSGRINLSCSALSMRRYVDSEVALNISSDLRNLEAQGFTSNQAALLFETILRDRQQRKVTENAFDLVVTSPKSSGILIRNTGTVVRELFEQAEHTVLVAGYAVYQGRYVFQSLATKMSERPELQVRLFLNIPSKLHDFALPKEMVRQFFKRFREQEWPVDHRMPELFYYLPSLDRNLKKQSCLHAKCVVVDCKSVLISSANFTEAAQNRNIEVGLSVRSSQLAQKLTAHFEMLLADGLFEPLNNY